MADEKFSNNIIQQIGEQKLVPRPRWRFLLKNGVLWSLTAGSTVLGGFAVATICFIIVDHDWDVFEYLDRSLFEHIIASLPYLWFAALVLLVFAIRYNFCHTKRGYRYSAGMVVAISIGGSMLLGVLLVAAGFDAHLHNFFLKQVPLYEQLTYTKDDVWIYPEKGLLSGRVLMLNNGFGFSLSDWRGRIWNVRIATDIDDKPVQISPGMRVKLIGRIEGPGMFEAKIVRPWGR